jgi:hypothetical protein
MVWGGRLENIDQMRLFELISIAINLFIIAMAAMKGGFVRSFLPEKVVRAILWGFTIMFTLNTIGNLLSETSLETIIFTPVTLLLAILFLRIALEGKLSKQPSAGY